MEESGFKFLQSFSGSGELLFSLLLIHILVLCAVMRFFYYKSRSKSFLSLGIIYSLLIVLLIFIFFKPALIYRKYAKKDTKLMIIADDSVSMNFNSKSGSTKWSMMNQIIESYKKKNRVKVIGLSGEDLSDEALYQKSSPERLFERLGREAGDYDSYWYLSDGLFKFDAEFFKKFPIPINTSVIESVEEKDIGIVSVDLPKFAFVHNQIEFSVEVFSKRIASGKLRLILDGKEIASEDFLFLNENAKVDFKFTPRKVGRSLVEIELVHQDGEITYLNNNSFHDLKINRDRTRVLQVTGQPSYDVRFLREYLKRDPSVDLISFFILRTPMDQQKVANEELSLIPFPTRELFTKQIQTFDVVVFQNFNFRPYNMRIYLRNIMNYVAKSGGAFIMIGGPLSFTEGEYYGTPLADILPVTLKRKESKSTYKKSSFSIYPNPADQTDVIFSSIYDERKFPSYLPKLSGLNLVEGLKPNARVLLKTDDSRPLLVLSEHEKGRVAAILSDELWKLNFKFNPSDSTRNPYVALWSDLLEWLMREEKNWISSPEMKRMDKQLLLSFKALAAREQITVLVKDRLGKEKSFNFDFKKDKDYSLSLEGDWNLPLNISIFSKEKALLDREFVLQKADLSEFDQRTDGVQNMKDIASLTGAGFISFDSFDDFKKAALAEKRGALVDEKIDEIWKHPLMYLLILLIFFLLVYREKKAGLG